jgi:hypothetical protein
MQRRHKLGKWGARRETGDFNGTVKLMDLEQKVG